MRTVILGAIGVVLTTACAHAAPPDSVPDAVPPGAVPQAASPASPRAAGPKGPPRPGKAALPDAADEGARDLSKTVVVLRDFVRSQPFGKRWADLVVKDPPPKDPTGLGKADGHVAHGALGQDPIEMQAQVQFLQEMGIEVRYGFASIRGVRVYHYGILSAVQLVIDEVGRDHREQFGSDVRALSDAWKNLPTAFGIKDTFRLTRNDLIEQPVKLAEKFPVAPLRIQLEPIDGRGGP